MYRTYNKGKNVTRESLLENPEFLEDARTFLKERNNMTGYLSPQKTLDEFQEHMRFHDTNEVTTLRDLTYAQDANLESKLRFANLIDAWDKLDGELSVKSAIDYGESILTAPSTYIGIATGGSGKAASVGATQAGKIALRSILAKATLQASKAAAVEGAIGAGQGVAQELTRDEVGLQEGVTGERTAKTAIASAATAGIINFPLAILQKGSVPKIKKGDREANELYESAQINQAKRATEASAKTAEVLQDGRIVDGKKVKTTEAEINKVKTTLNALDPEKVRKGRQIKMMSSTSSTLEASLPSETVDNIVAAAIRAKDVLKPKEGQRITSALQEALSKRDIDIFDEVGDILEEHNLTYDEFSLFYLAEVSEAGRTLGSQSQLKRSLTPRMGETKNEVDMLLDSVDQLNVAGKSSLDSTLSKQFLNDRLAVDNVFFNLALKSGRTVKDLDRLRLGFMTIQPKTTMRNTYNGGFRVFVDATTRTMDNVLSNLTGRQLKNPFDGTFDMAKHLLNPSESRVMRQLLTETFPVKLAKLFRDAADLEAVGNSDSGLAVLARKVNFLNTLSDNLFKRGILTASLNRRVNDARVPITDKIKMQLLEGRMLRQMDESSVKDAIDNVSDINTLYKEYGNIDKKKFVSLNDMAETGNLRLLDNAVDPVTKEPRSIIDEAIKDAYQYTYQEGFVGKDLFGKLAQQGIKAHQAAPFLVSSFMPFPRFVANQIKFVYEHMPIIGMLPLDRLSGKAFENLSAKTAAKYYRERLPKQMTGALMFTAAYQWRALQGPETEWYEFKNNKGQIVDGRPLYGPFSMFMFGADMLYRYQNGMPRKRFAQHVRDGSQALLGSSLRVGFGIYALDKLFEEPESLVGWKSLAEGMANIINTFAIPANVVRDVYAQFNEDARGIPETRNGEVNFVDILYSRATRSLPKNYLSEVDGESVNILPDQDWFSTEKRARSPFQTGPLKPIDPLESQFTGALTREKKNDFQNEMTRLQLGRSDIYKRDNNEIMDKYVRDELSRKDGANNLNEKMKIILDSDAYKNAVGDMAKRNLFIRYSKEIIADAKDAAKARMEAEAQRDRQPFTPSMVTQYEKLPKRIKDAVNEEYVKVYEGNSVLQDRKTNLFIDGQPMNVLRWALEEASRLRGKEGGL
jgi:hypothetical protein